jgi:hypothetical protein
MKGDHPMTPSDAATRTAVTLLEDRQPPANPFVALRYHFGMLLGVEDFETEQAYHRGKNRLHNAWLHGEGVVWGLEVGSPLMEGGVREELEVRPGLALDAAGNELHLHAPYCLDLSDWYERKKEERRLDASGEVEQEDGTIAVKVEAHVAARFRVCLMRPVPALMEPCDGTGGDTAYSRAQETIDLRLEPTLAPAPPADPYHRLRLLFGLAGPRLEDGAPVPADQEVLDRLDGIRAADPDARGALALEAFRRLAAHDAADLRPGTRDGAGEPSARYPADDRPPVLLAAVTVRLRRRAEERRWSVEEIDIDNGVRPAHVATRTIQELLCAALLGDGAAEPAGGDGAAATAAPAPRAAEDAGGPRVEPDSVSFRDGTVEFRVSAQLAARSVGPDAFEVVTFDRRRGWVRREIEQVGYDGRRRRVSVRLGEGADGEVLRLVVRGTGATPLLGGDLVPLAGAVGGPPGTSHQGHDFILMLPARS